MTRVHKGEVSSHRRPSRRACAAALWLTAWPCACATHAADNQALDGGGGGVALNPSVTVTINRAPLALVKQARDLGGVVLANGAAVTAGQTLYFVLYVDNPTAYSAPRLRLSDALDEAEFDYLPGSLETTVVASGANDAAIWAGSWTALSDALGAPDDFGSVVDSGGPAGPDRVTLGDVAGQANQPLNVAAGTLRAVRFRVTVR